MAEKGVRLAPRRASGQPPTPKTFTVLTAHYVQSAIRSEMDARRLSITPSGIGFDIVANDWLIRFGEFTFRIHCEMSQRRFKRWLRDDLPHKIPAL